LTKAIRVVTFISEQISGAAQAAQQGRGGCDVGHIAGGEHQGEWAAEDVGERMDLGRLAATRETDRLFFLPPSPPNAERCAFT
jgi:hypothetical protein